MTNPNRPRFRQTLTTGSERAEVSPYLPVAEDLDWLRSDWCSVKKPPTSAELRRGSATLRLLLCHGVVHNAWRYHGMDGVPTIIGPDLHALAAHHNHELRHAASVISGGAVVDDVQFCFVGAWRVKHPKTGVPADAEEGFAVETGSIARHLRGEPELNELTPLVEREWRIGQYAEAPGAIRRGQTISRRLIIEFFANYAGGVHLDRATGQANAEKKALYELVGELEDRVAIDEVEGLYFELLSIGQALGQSPSLRNLVEAVRRNDRPGRATASDGNASPGG